MKKKNNLVYKGLAIAGAFFLGKYVVDAIINFAYNTFSVKINFLFC
jgi:hypothetical protein